MSPPCYATRPDRVLAHEFSSEIKKPVIRLLVGAILLLIVKCHSGSPWSVAMITSITIVMIMITMVMIIIIIVTNLIVNIINVSVSRPPPPA